MNYKELRKQYGLSQIDMAAMLKVSLNAYILWERGVNSPNEENQQKLDEVIEKLKKQEGK